MGKGVSEWPSADVFSRKYHHSWTVVEGPKEELSLVWVNDIGGDTYLLDITGAPIKQKPVYFHFESGYYRNQLPDPFPCVYYLTRQFKSAKSYKVGLSDDDWSLLRVPVPHGDTQKVSLDPRIKLDIFGADTTLTQEGILARKYLFTTDRVLCLNKLIGLKNKKKLVINTQSFRQELSQLLDRSWEIS